MSKIIKVDTNGVKPLLDMRELGYDNYPAGGDVGRVYVGTGTANIPLAKKVEVTAVDTKADTHIGRVDNPHSVTKAQVGLGNVDNTSDASKPISTATQTALNTKVGTTGNQTIAGIKTFSSNPISTATQSIAVDALTRKDYVDGLNSTNVKQYANLSDLANTVTARTNLGLGTASTKNVGTSSGNVMEVGAFGLGATTPSWISVTAKTPVGIYVDNDYPNPASPTYGAGLYYLSLGDGAYGGKMNFHPQENRVYYTYKQQPTSATDWVELISTGNILASTGSSTALPMTQKAVTDELNTKVGLSGNQTIAGIKTFTSTPKIGTDNITSISTSVTDNTIARFDGTTGKLQDSGVVIDDGGNMSVSGHISYHRGNILGAVSHLGGMPTGAIIEKGSNANGEYTKFADGTQICIHILNGYGYSLANSAYITWTVPAEFTSVPTYLASCQRGANDSIQIFARQGIVTATQSNWAHSAEPTVGVNFNLFAIGRWK